MEEEHCWTYWDWPIPSSAVVEVVQPTCPWGSQKSSWVGVEGEVLQQTFWVFDPLQEPRGPQLLPAFG